MNCLFRPGVTWDTGGQDRNVFRKNLAAEFSQLRGRLAFYFKERQIFSVSE